MLFYALVAVFEKAASTIVLAYCLLSCIRIKKYAYTYLQVDRLVNTSYLFDSDLRVLFESDEVT